MADKVVTIKDIASDLGISLTTVHKALYNKKGVSENTRQKVLDYVEENHFQINKAASALKRRPIKLVAMLIEPVGTNAYFYADILSGVDEALNDLQPFNVELVKYYAQLETQSQRTVLEKILREQGDGIDGLLLVPAHATGLNDLIERFFERNVKICTVNSDIKHIARDVCVTSDTTTSGRLAAELMSVIGLPENSQVLLIAGDRDMFNHLHTSKGFLSCIKEESPNVDILELYDNQDAESLERKLRKFLGSFEDLAGIYSNTSRNTLIMCRTIQEMGLSKELTVIGSDVFPELIPYFENRTLTASIYQNPTLQAYKGLQSLYYLVTGELQVPEILSIRTGIILRNNAKSYLNHNQ